MRFSIRASVAAVGAIYGQQFEHSGFQMGVSTATVVRVTVR
jgi:hypothetical protein